MFFRVCVTCVFIVALLLAVTGVQAQVMSSPNYQLQSDSINFGGGLSSSTNYVQESTFGEVGTGPSDSASYSLRAGYQQMHEIYLALTSVDDVVMDPNIVGIGGGLSNGSTTLTATTDNPAGYTLAIRASDSPAMNSGGNSITDYVPVADPNPDRGFAYGTADAYFGYSPFGADTVQKFQTDGADCNVAGVASSTACWEGLSLTDETIAQGMGPNQPDGATTTIYFKVGVGSSVVQVPGSYVATTTVTLLPL